MPRKKYIATDEFCYHLSARSANRKWFGIEKDLCWEIFSNRVHQLNHAFNFKIHNFLLMDNHYHMIVRTPDRNLAEGMNYFQGESSREIGRESGVINQVFGGPYNWSIINTQSYYLNAYKYVYRNPIEAGLCARVEDYPYSTLHGLLGQSRLIIPVEFDDTLFNDVEGTLRWMNNDFSSPELRDAIGRGLKRREFKLPKKFL